MAQQQKPAEVQAEHLRALGAKAGSFYSALYGEVAWIHVKWKQYRGLFEDPANVATLNRSAGFLFGVLQDVLWREVVLHVARLLDPPRSAGKETLTLRRLPQMLRDQAVPRNQGLAKDVAALVKEAQKRAEFARDWRNRILAHRDLAHALNPSARPLESASREKMEKVLEAMRAVLNKVEKHYWDNHVMFEVPSTPAGDARALLSRLARANREEDERIARLRAGVPRPEDLRP
jgi:hypothetical protein